jgi:hypothetical protein
MFLFVVLFVLWLLSLLLSLFVPSFVGWLFEVAVVVGKGGLRDGGRQAEGEAQGRHRSDVEKSAALLFEFSFIHLFPLSL